MTGISAVCSCGEAHELVREGVQVSTINRLQEFLRQHERCRPGGDVVIRTVAGK